EAGARCRVEPPRDQFPRLESVGERERAKIVAERRANPRRDGEHRGDPGHDGDIERTPAFRTGFDLFADRGRHSEDAGVAAGDDGNARALRRVNERGGGAGTFLAIVGRVAALARAYRHAIEIGTIAVKRLRDSQHLDRLRREIAGVARSQSDDCEMPAHGRSSQPGTNTTAKYGASSSVLAARGIITASAMVPRST